MSEDKQDRQITLNEFINKYIDFGISLSEQNKSNVFLSNENKFPLDKANTFVSLCDLPQLEKQFYLYCPFEAQVNKDLALLYSKFYFLLFNSIYSLANIYENNKKYLSINEQSFSGHLKINKNNIQSALIFPEEAGIYYEVSDNSISITINLGNNKKLSIENITFIEKKTTKKVYVEIKVPLLSSDILDLCFEKPIYIEYLGSVFNKTLINIVN